MFFIFILLLIPAFIYYRLVELYQTPVLVVTVVVILIVLIFFAVHLTRESRAFSSRPKAASSVWQAVMDATQFQVAFINYVTGLGYEVLWSRILDQHRVAFAIQRRKQKFVLLCLNETGEVRESDLIKLDGWRAEIAPERSLIVVTRPPANPPARLAESNVEVLTYEGLGMLTA